MWPVDVDEAQFPPFTETSGWLARKLLDGEIDRVVEILGVNGHAFLEAEAGWSRVAARVYLSARPLARGGPWREWKRMISRLAAAEVPVLASRIEYRGGYVVYEAASSRWEDLARFIAGARRLAGLVPHTTPLVDNALAYPHDSDTGNLAATMIVEPLIDAVSDPEDALKRLSPPRLLYGPVLLENVAEAAGLGKATMHRVMRHLAELGAAVKIGRHYYILLRHELILSNYMAISFDPVQSCMLLPYLAAVRHVDWEIYPGPYEECQDVSKELARLEAELLGSSP